MSSGPAVWRPSPPSSWWICEGPGREQVHLPALCPLRAVGKERLLSCRAQGAGSGPRPGASKPRVPAEEAPPPPQASWVPWPDEQPLEAGQLAFCLSWSLLIHPWNIHMPHLRQQWECRPLSSARPNLLCVSAEFLVRPQKGAEQVTESAGK